MDITLRSFLKHADEIHKKIESMGILIESDDIKKDILDMQKNIKLIQNICYHIANVTNVATKILKYKEKFSHEKTHHKNMTDPYPNIYDSGSIRLFNYSPRRELMPNISIPIKYVEMENEIPAVSIYYINSLKQYAINISGVIIRGNLCDIKQTNETPICKYGIKCTNILNNSTCKYWHDPSDYINMGKPVPTSVRTFAPGSWIYDQHCKKHYTRHIGGTSTLENDLYKLVKHEFSAEIYNREGQLMHDLLIYMILASKGMLSRYELEKKFLVRINNIFGKLKEV